MNAEQVKQFIWEMDRKHKKVVFTADELGVVFEKENKNSLNVAIHSLVKKGFLLRMTKGVYLFRHHTQNAYCVLGQMVAALRPDCFSYRSLEDVLSESGVISQVALTRTFMTTGRSGIFQKPQGVIEFIHTKKDISTIIDDLFWNEYFYQAKVKRAFDDLKRVGRNMHMVSLEDLEDIENE